ncbi:lipopolysaccharide biosynthesis protein [Bacteroides sp. ET225]|uniref:lipopolysaccharide biosynthesis protein n=1 Tax=Bacteroides sp. ET225 TaxID=2972461 RepID=UPI0021ACD7CC|nr:MATE family efflux transporter [Bacteroides sp. ET225]MCR8918317.1 oligosaccharide flippase family protein [Bacteroides sp. ET225]
MDSNKKRIIKNTGFLYVRMFITMCISFMTTRIVLDKLGVSDYGIYNIVGGFISMFTVLNSILQTGTRRFLALNLGKGDKNVIKETFSTAFVIHLTIACIVTVFIETIGLWFLNYKLNIPPERMSAANWIFQFSMISVFLNITQTPFTAAVTAHERFNIYAFISIFDAIAKVITVYLLVTIPGDKLIIYGLLILIVNFIVICLYRIYCIKHFEECKFSLKINKEIFKEMAQFSGWSTLGHFSAVLNGNGISVILNLFFGTTINAARGLANTVTYTIRQFVDGFITASQPQLIKLYGAGNIPEFHQLIFTVSKYSLFLLSIIVTPVILEIDFVLNLWLDTVPSYTPIFIKITMIICLLSYSNNMLDQGVVASGYIKQLTCITTPMYLLDLPLTYIVLKLGGTPPTAYMVGALPLFLAFLSNLYILKKYTKFPARKYFLSVFLKNLLLLLIASIIPVYIQSKMPYGIERFLTVCSISVICTITILYCLALDKNTRTMVNNKIKSLIRIK